MQTIGADMPKRTIRRVTRRVRKIKKQRVQCLCCRKWVYKVKCVEGEERKKHSCGVYLPCEDLT